MHNITKAGAMQDESKESRFMIVFDVIFVLVLCVSILLVTMLVQNRLPAAEGYAITWTSLLVLGTMAGLFLFIIRNSLKEWHSIIKNQYGEDAKAAGKENK